MNIYKLILVSLLTWFFLGNGFTQEKITDSSQLPQLGLQRGNDEGKNIKVSIDSLYHRIRERENVINKSKPFKKIELLNQDIADKDTIIEIQTEIIKEKVEVIKSNEPILKIVDFFKIEDTSIFNSNFNYFTQEEIPLYLQSHYRLITNIHKLDSLIAYIEQKVATIESEKDPIQLKPANLKSLIKKDLNEADALIEQIEKQDRSGLYPEQAKFYRPDLIDKFNTLLGKTFSK